MSDGYTKVMDMVVECPQCHKESGVRVATGIEIDTQRKSISCAYCKNPWVEFLPGELVAGPYEIQNLPPPQT